MVVVINPAGVILKSPMTINGRAMLVTKVISPDHSRLLVGPYIPSPNLK